MKKLLLSILSITMLVSCASESTEQPVQQEQAKANKLDKLKWWLGNWQMKSADGLVIESWSNTAANEWQGYSYYLTPQGDTASHETVRLVNDNDTLFYIPNVSNQNNGMSIQFRESMLSDSSIVFENTTHDFPKRIVYVKTSDTSIHAYIEGSGKIVDFYYLKVH
ncbi:MAG: hypothetical protein J0L80_09635 [Chitinophagales bacterium]|nr:hypothetical protein [Chitinophagales bacterium]